MGSGVTGAEFAGAYNALGSDVVLVSSRDRVLPGEDADAAEAHRGVFRSRGMTVMSRTRAEAAVRTEEGVEVTLADGRVVKGSHVLLAVGSIPSTAGIGLEEAGVRLTPGGHVQVDKVSRTSVRGIYAAGDCTGILPLASVAAMQGRVAMSHALGDAVSPIKLRTVAANIFTAPEIATVGYGEEKLKEQGSRYVTTTLPLARNPRAKMLGMRDGFVACSRTPRRASSWAAWSSPRARASSSSPSRSRSRTVSRSTTSPRPSRSTRRCRGRSRRSLACSTTARTEAQAPSVRRGVGPTGCPGGGARDAGATGRPTGPGGCGRRGPRTARPRGLPRRSAR